MLFLFDIDGTLLGGATRVHREALHGALLEIHGVDAQTVRGPLSPAGRTDGEIARAILVGAGVDIQRIDERADAVTQTCCQIYAQLSTADLSHTVLPGMRELLNWLSAREQAALGLVTGNFEPVARLKLGRAGIGGHFPPGQGAFGSDSEARAALPAIARARAGTPGVPHPRERTLVIGDTPRDIACARADQLRCVAIATGPHPPEELGDADAVVRDGWELRVTLERLLAGDA
ncbi:MAG: HAD family hydrolase [Solirubrobacteraceae bacterium]